MSRQEAIAQYTAAWKLGQRYYKAALAKGSYPYPQVLEEILNERMSAGRIELGLVDPRPDGFIDPSDVEAAITDQTILISVAPIFGLTISSPSGVNPHFS